MAIAYRYFLPSHYFAEAVEDHGFLPANSTYIAPILREGYIPRWAGEGWEQVENHKGKKGYLYGLPHTINDYGPLPEGWSDAPPPQQLEDAKAAKLQQIDAETSTAILAGFDYEIDGEKLHFSYDTNDQLNFTNAQAMANMSLRGVPGVPESTSWNGWKIEKDEDGVEVSRSLVRINLDANAFLALFMEGAMMHTASLMERGGQRKAQVDAATTIEELEAI